MNRYERYEAEERTKQNSKRKPGDLVQVRRPNYFGQVYPGCPKSLSTVVVAEVVWALTPIQVNGEGNTFYNREPEMEYTLLHSDGRVNPGWDDATLDLHSMSDDELIQRDKEEEEQRAKAVEEFNKAWGLSKSNPSAPFYGVDRSTSGIFGGPIHSVLVPANIAIQIARKLKVIV